MAVYTEPHRKSKCIRAFPVLCAVVYWFTKNVTRDDGVVLGLDD